LSAELALVDLATSWMEVRLQVQMDVGNCDGRWYIEGPMKDGGGSNDEGKGKCGGLSTTSRDETRVTPVEMTNINEQWRRVSGADSFRVA
jgi:hypothetical protein